MGLHGKDGRRRRLEAESTAELHPTPRLPVPWPLTRCPPPMHLSKQNHKTLNRRNPELNRSADDLVGRAGSASRSSSQHQEPVCGEPRASPGLRGLSTQRNAANWQRRRASSLEVSSHHRPFSEGSAAFLKHGSTQEQSPSCPVGQCSFFLLVSPRESAGPVHPPGKGVLPPAAQRVTAEGPTRQVRARDHAVSPPDAHSSASQTYSSEDRKTH